MSIQVFESRPMCHCPATDPPQPHCQFISTLRSRNVKRARSLPAAKTPRTEDEGTLEDNRSGLGSLQALVRTNQLANRCDRTLCIVERQNFRKNAVGLFIDVPCIRFDAGSTALKQHFFCFGE